MILVLSEERVNEALRLLESLESNTTRCPDTEKQFRRIREILREG